MAQAEPNLSLVVLAWNEEESVEAYLRETLAWLDTRPGSHEILLIDDGSTDRTAEITRRVAQEDPRVRLVSHAVNRGMGGGMRSGFASARGDYVTILAADGQVRAHRQQDPAEEQFPFDSPTLFHGLEGIEDLVIDAHALRAAYLEAQREHAEMLKQGCLAEGVDYVAMRTDQPLDEALASYDLVVVVTDHSSMDWARVVEHSRLVVDTRNATRDVREGAKHVFLA